MTPTRILAALATISAGTTAAATESYQMGPRMFLDEGYRDNCFATVRVYNTLGNYNETETLETDRGPVEIRYETVGGHNPADDDLVEVVSTPLGVSAEPAFMAVPDDESLTICLYETPMG